MKALKYWTTSVAFDTAVFWLFYLWQIKEIEGAGNAFSFVVWWLVVTRTFMAFRINKETVAKNPRPPLFAQYHFATEIVTILALAWIGHTFAAVCYAVSYLLFEGARMMEPKQEQPIGESK